MNVRALLMEKGEKKKAKRVVLKDVNRDLMVALLAIPVYYLDYFTIYKAKDRVMMPETKNTPKKGQAYIVLASELRISGNLTAIFLASLSFPRTASKM